MADVPAPENLSGTPDSSGLRLEGRRVKTYWEGESDWFPGTVHPRHKRWVTDKTPWTIKFDDGDKQHGHFRQNDQGQITHWVTWLDDHKEVFEAKLIKEGEDENTDDEGLAPAERDGSKRKVRAPSKYTTEEEPAAKKPRAPLALRVPGSEPKSGSLAGGSPPHSQQQDVPSARNTPSKSISPEPVQQPDKPAQPAAILQPLKETKPSVQVTPQNEQLQTEQKPSDKQPAETSGKEQPARPQMPRGRLSHPSLQKQEGGTSNRSVQLIDMHGRPESKSHPGQAQGSRPPSETKPKSSKVMTFSGPARPTQGPRLNILQLPKHEPGSNGAATISTAQTADAAGVDMNQESADVHMKHEPASPVAPKIEQHSVHGVSPGVLPASPVYSPNFPGSDNRGNVHGRDSTTYTSPPAENSFAQAALLLNATSARSLHLSRSSSHHSGQSTPIWQENMSEHADHERGVSADLEKATSNAAVMPTASLQSHHSVQSNGTPYSDLVAHFRQQTMQRDNSTAATPASATPATAGQTPGSGAKTAAAAASNAFAAAVAAATGTTKVGGVGRTFRLGGRDPRDRESGGKEAAPPAASGPRSGGFQLSRDPEQIQAFKTALESLTLATTSVKATSQAAVEAAQAVGSCGAVIRAIVERRDFLTNAASHAEAGSESLRQLQEKRLALVFLLDNMMARFASLKSQQQPGGEAPAGGSPSSQQQQATTTTPELAAILKELPGKVASCCKHIIPGCLPDGEGMEGKANKLKKVIDSWERKAYFAEGETRMLKEVFEEERARGLRGANIAAQVSHPNEIPPRRGGPGPIANTRPPPTMIQPHGSKFWQGPHRIVLPNPGKLACDPEVPFSPFRKQNGEQAPVEPRNTLGPVGQPFWIGNMYGSMGLGGLSMHSDASFLHFLGKVARFAEPDDINMFQEDEEDRQLFAHAMPWKTYCIVAGIGMQGDDEGGVISHPEPPTPRIGGPGMQQLGVQQQVPGFNNGLLPPGFNPQQTHAEMAELARNMSMLIKQQQMDSQGQGAANQMMPGNQMQGTMSQQSLFGVGNMQGQQAQMQPNLQPQQQRMLGLAPDQLMGSNTMQPHASRPELTGPIPSSPVFIDGGHGSPMRDGEMSVREEGEINDEGIPLYDTGILPQANPDDFTADGLERDDSDQVAFAPAAPRRDELEDMQLDTSDEEGEHVQSRTPVEELPPLPSEPPPDDTFPNQPAVHMDVSAAQHRTQHMQYGSVSGQQQQPYVLMPPAQQTQYQPPQPPLPGQQHGSLYHVQPAVHQQQPYSSQLQGGYEQPPPPPMITPGMFPPGFGPPAHLLQSQPPQPPSHPVHHPIPHQHMQLHAAPPLPDEPRPPLPDEPPPLPPDIPALPEGPPPPLPPHRRPQVEHPLEGGRDHEGATDGNKPHEIIIAAKQATADASSAASGRTPVAVQQQAEGTEHQAKSDAPRTDTETQEECEEATSDKAPHQQDKAPAAAASAPDGQVAKPVDTDPAKPTGSQRPASEVAAKLPRTSNEKTSKQQSSTGTDTRQPHSKVAGMETGKVAPNISKGTETDAGAGQKEASTVPAQGSKAKPASHKPAKPQLENGAEPSAAQQSQTGTSTVQAGKTKPQAVGAEAHKAGPAAKSPLSDIPPIGDNRNTNSTDPAKASVANTSGTSSLLPQQDSTCQATGSASKTLADLANVLASSPLGITPELLSLLTPGMSLGLPTKKSSNNAPLAQVPSKASTGGATAAKQSAATAPHNTASIPAASQKLQTPPSTQKSDAQPPVKVDPVKELPALQPGSMTKKRKDRDVGNADVTRFASETEMQGQQQAKGRASVLYHDNKPPCEEQDGSKQPLLQRLIANAKEFGMRDAEYGLHGKQPATLPPQFHGKHKDFIKPDARLPSDDRDTHEHKKQRTQPAEAAHRHDKLTHGVTHQHASKQVSLPPRQQIEPLSARPTVEAEQPKVRLPLSARLRRPPVAPSDQPGFHRSVSPDDVPLSNTKQQSVREGRNPHMEGKRSLLIDAELPIARQDPDTDPPAKKRRGPGLLAGGASRLITGAFAGIVGNPSRGR